MYINLYYVGANHEIEPYPSESYVTGNKHPQ